MPWYNDFQKNSNLRDSAASCLGTDEDTEGREAAEPKVDEARPAEGLHELGGAPVDFEIVAQKGVFVPAEDRGICNMDFVLFAFYSLNG